MHFYQAKPDESGFTSVQVMNRDEMEKTKNVVATKAGTHTASEPEETPPNFEEGERSNKQSTRGSSTGDENNEKDNVEECKVKMRTVNVNVESTGKRMHKRKERLLEAVKHKQKVTEPVPSNEIPVEKPVPVPQPQEENLSVGAGASKVTTKRIQRRLKPKLPQPPGILDAPLIISEKRKPKPKLPKGADLELELSPVKRKSPNNPQAKKKRGRPRKHSLPTTITESPANMTERQPALSLPPEATTPNVLTTNTCREKPCRWLVGDLIWAKILGHPWWPCMVTFDPLLGQYTQMKGHATKGYRQYHVQFFGDSLLRGWVNDGSSVEFTGLMHFNNFVKEQVESAKTNSAKKSVRKRYEVKPSQAWDIAVKAAEEAIQFSRNERKQKYTFVYMDLGLGGTSDIKAAQPKEASETFEEKKVIKQSTSRKRRQSTTDLPKKKKLKQEKVESITEDASGKHYSSEEETVVVLKKKRKGLKLHLSLSRSPKSTAAERQIESPDPQTPPPCKPENIAEPGTAAERIMSVDAMQKLEHKEKKWTNKLKRKKGANFLMRLKENGSSSASTSARSSDSEDHLVIDVPSSHSSSSGSETSRSLRPKETACVICEKVGTHLITCSAGCHNSFHRTCLGVSIPTGSTLAFKCDECLSGIHPCFICRQTLGIVKKCSAVCGKYYHDACLQIYPGSRLEERNFCPRHACLTCYADDPKNVHATKGRMQRCIRCPTTYHVGDMCIAAGSVQLTSSLFICPRHFQRVKLKAHHVGINVNWCFICGRGGDLLCCESCPAAFHPGCIGTQPPDGAWYCEDCISGKRPLYGDIVWVKLGCYRWWPAEICYLRNVPHNILDLPHQVGEFTVCFFGSHDYYWVHRGRVFHFDEGDKGSKDKTSSANLAKQFKAAVEEATLAFQSWQSAKESRLAQVNEKNGRKPAPYKHIKTNRPIGKVQVYTKDPSELTPCECRADMEHPCRYDSDCLNCMMYYECHPAVCPAGEHCENQRFVKMQYMQCEPVKVGARGWGLLNLEPIKKGQFVGKRNICLFFLNLRTRDETLLGCFYFSVYLFYAQPFYRKILQFEDLLNREVHKTLFIAKANV